MHILITGANGFIGRHAVRYFANAKYRVTAMSRSAPVGFSSEPNIDWLVADLSQAPYCLPEGIDVVVHTAARSPYHGGEEEDFFLDNVEGTEHLAKAVIAAGCQKMIFLSAISLYGTVSVECVDEHTPALPEDSYGRSKLAAENILQGLSNHLQTLVLRLPGIVGPGAHSPWLSKCLATLRRGAMVQAYNPDAAFNNVLHINDLLTFIESQFAASGKAYDILTLCSSNPVSVRKALDILQKISSRSGAVEFAESQKQSFVVSNTRACMRYGFRPKDVAVAIRCLDTSLNSSFEVEE